MRLFLAIHLPDAAIEHLRRVQAHLRSVAPDIPYTRDVNLHLTVRFIGELEDGMLDPLKDAVRRVCASGASLQLAASRLVAFPWQKPANIIAAEIGGETVDQLILTQSAIERALRGVGVAPEQRKYTPHVTLARPQRPLPLPLVQKMINTTRRSWPGPGFQIRRIHLVASELLPTGAKYRDIADFDLFG